MIWNISRISKERYGVAAITGGFLIHFTLGNLYSFGNMMTYMDSYMHNRVDELVTYTNFIWVMSVTTATQGLFMTFGEIIEKKVGVKLTCLIGSCLFSSGIALTYFTINMSFAAVIFTYGFLNGLGLSLTYVTPLACSMQWFPTHKGFASGIVVGGFGLGSLGSTTLQTLFLNPENMVVAKSGYFEDSAVLDRVPNVFILMGGALFALQLIGCALISKPSSTLQVPTLQPESASLLSDEEEKDPNLLLKKSPLTLDFRIRKRDLSTLEAVRTKEFCIFWLIYFFNTIAVGYINAMYKNFGQTFIADDFFFAKVGSLAAIFNFCGRIAWGKLMDKTSFRFSMCLMTICLSILYLSLSLTALQGKLLFAIWIWAIFFCFSGTFVLISAATEKAFGSSHYSSIYGLTFTSQVVSAIVLSMINEILLLRIGYAGCFATIGIIVSIGTTLTIALPKSL